MCRFQPFFFRPSPAVDQLCIQGFRCSSSRLGKALSKKHERLTGRRAKDSAAAADLTTTLPATVTTSDTTRPVRLQPAMDASEPMETDDPSVNSPAAAENDSGGGGRSSDMAEEDDDDYKAEATFQFEVTSMSKMKTQQLSPPVYVRGLPWKIMAMPRDNGRNTKHLGFFLQCNGESESANWSCSAQATLRIKSQKEGIPDHEKNISHIFYPKENDWGYSCFLPLEAVLDAERGYIKDDKIVLEVHVYADAPHGVQWDSKKHTGYVGLKNQGATCYMNSLLQALFFTNKLRKAVYQMPTENDDPLKSVALSMQRVFYELQFSDKPVGTKKLTRSFGWDAFDSFLQHDVQELCRVLLDNLESKMKGTPVESVIPDLFEGKMKSYIRCKTVPFESNREEPFYDIQLNVKGKKNIYESFKDYVAVETLEGDNKYDAGQYGLQEAQKGVIFLKFPPILHLQLMRVQYDSLHDQNVKINDRFEFPEKLDLDEFLESSEETPAKYTLHAVLVHSGDFHGGHYVVYINPKGNGRWCKFDDDVVSRCTKREAIEVNYGGSDSDVSHRHCTNAYMLAYIRDSCLSDILEPVDETDIPAYLKQRLQAEKDMETLKKKEKSEAHLFCQVNIITEDLLEGHQGNEIIDVDYAERLCRKFRVKRSMKYDDFCAFIGQQFNLRPNTQFRLWPLSRSQSLALRPYFPFSDGDATLERCFAGGENQILIFMEIYDYAHGMTELPPYNQESDIWFFVRYYDAVRKLMIYCGHVIVNVNSTLASISGELCHRVHLPITTELVFFQEDRVGKLSIIEHQDEVVRSSLIEFSDGVVIIFQTAETFKNPQLLDAEGYCKELSDRIELELIDRQLDNAEPILLPASLRWQYHYLAETVGRRIGCDPYKIQFFRSASYKETPGLAIKWNPDLTLRTVFDGIAQVPNQRFRLLYQRVPLRIDELENRQQVKVVWMDSKFQLTELTVYPDRDGTVKEVLREVKNVVSFAVGGSGKLRLLQVSGNRVSCVMASDINVEHLTPPHQYRVEEIPLDQVNVDPKTEYLLPVAHFYKDSYQTFGIPFLIKVRNGEPFCSVKRRIQSILETSDKEFEKYKFALCTTVRTQYFDNENYLINLNELNQNSQFSGTNKPWLGLDHVNKSAKGRGIHPLEKAIVIHN